MIHDFRADIDKVSNAPMAHCAAFGCGQLREHANHTRPIREVLAAAFGPDVAKQIYIDPSYQSAFDNTLVDGVRLVSTAGTGNLQFLCGGLVIMHLFSKVRAQTSSAAYYIVVNDDRGKKWDYERTQGKGFHEIGSRPMERLEFVIGG